jgi:hypothetical protein
MIVQWTIVDRRRVGRPPVALCPLELPQAERDGKKLPLRSPQATSLTTDLCLLTNLEFSKSEI